MQIYSRKPRNIQNWMCKSKTVLNILVVRVLRCELHFFFSRWRLSTCPWFYLWVGPGMLWPTLWLDIWWAAANGHPSANWLHGQWSYILQALSWIKLQFTAPPAFIYHSTINVYHTGWFSLLRSVSCPICCCGLCLEAQHLRLSVCCGSSQ